MRNSFAVALLLASLASVDGFSGPLFPSATATASKGPVLKAPTEIEGVEIEMPNFDALFGRIQQVSPLARQVIEGRSRNGERGFKFIDDKEKTDLKWKTVESNSKKTVHQIDKVDNFMKLGPPLLRFRSTLKGPCVGEIFAKFIMDLEEREKWDPQIAQNHELYPVHDLDTVNIAMGPGKYGTCSRFGVGYCQTKAAMGVTPREQLILGGMQDFEDGCHIMWGTEMEEWHNHLLPPGTRHTRAKSHLFCTTLVPTSEETFDVEYLLQMDVGGNLPGFLTTPVVTDTVKGLFTYAEKYYGGGEGSEIHQWKLENWKDDFLDFCHSLLMTP